MQTKIYRIQTNKSIMCGYFCIGFIDFMLAGKRLIDYAGMSTPYDLKKDKTISGGITNLYL